MEKSAKFKVDPALTKISGDSYTSVEAAIKELVDNCYDADSSMVSVDFPNPFEHSKIIISDNGDGMTQCFAQQYICDRRGLLHRNNFKSVRNFTSCLVFCL